MTTLRAFFVRRSRHWMFALPGLLAGVLLGTNPSTLPAAEEPLQVGVAQVDITPDYPVRLNGFGFRRTESEGVTQKIWAKALAFADEAEGPALLITTDNLCVSDEITQEIAVRLASKIKLKRERLTITATHTHTAPMLRNVAPTLFGLAIPPEHQANIDRYTREFVDKLEQVALDAVKDIQPAKVSWGNGKVGFAINRRTKGGPVDHDLPMLVVRGIDEKVRATYFSYACHCVTLSNNKISGDWAGFAQEAVQKLFPGSVALASVGCGADSNPASGVVGDKTATCAQQGQQIADEIQRLLRGQLTAITARPIARLSRVKVAFDTPRTRVEWEERAKSKDGAIAHHAKGNLARLDRGEALPTHLDYPIQTWLFGEQLAVVFLPGETVVDYSLRLKRELDRSRLWVNGYANDGRCYVPSERILKEGGYEGGGAMVYYDMPNRFAPGLEQNIIDAVHQQIPKSFAVAKGTEGTKPLTPSESLRAIRTKPGLKVELVAAEPLIVDPVAIDWGADGRLWVCEMHDYPTGIDEKWQPGGRIKFLTDTNGDGQYDRSTLFLDDLPFPTGVTAWGRGVLVCAAPDVLYAEDTNGDGKADRVEKVFTGFPTDNYQARVNSLSLGLDNWIYGANGLLGATIRGEGRPLPGWPNTGFGQRSGDSKEISIRNRDFRFRPETGALEPASGLTQQGRVRDDWGNWFGCDNGRMLLSFPLPEHYVRRNPHVSAPDPILNLTARANGSRVHPSSQLLERFNDPDNANQATSACGLGLYRDTLLGEEFYGNAFTCEPVHNLVHREVLKEEGAKFSSRRAPDESASEFFASTDNWFRPAQVRTGPDGGLYIVDLYRFLIEHPRWIAAGRLAQIDVRAGSDKGRIYRLRPETAPLRPVRDLTKLNISELAAGLNSPNGTERDRVHAELLYRKDKKSAPVLEKLASHGSNAAIRVQSLSALEGLSQLKQSHVERALQDSEPHVRQHALRLSEPWLRQEPSRALFSKLLRLRDDSSPLVRHQLALSLGESTDLRAGRILSALAKASLNDWQMRAAVLTSARVHCGEILDEVMNTDASAAGRALWLPPLVATAAASTNEALLTRALAAVLPPLNTVPSAGEMAALGSLFDALERRQMSVAEASRRSRNREMTPRLQHALTSARRLAADATAVESTRTAAIQLLGRESSSGEEMDLLCSLATSSGSDPLRKASFVALRRQRSEEVSKRLLAQWPQSSPAIRAQIVSFLLARDEWTRDLLGAIERGTIRAPEISLADRQRLTQSANAEVRQLALKVFPALPTGGRTEVLKQYEGVALLSGQVANGAELYTRSCATCHAIGQAGHEVGPNLAVLRDKDADYWVKNILDPNAVVEPRFISYQVEFKDDRSLSGIIKAETANSLTLVMGNGGVETILRSDVREIRASTLSLMPEGLEQGISRQGMADLIAFLKSSRAPKTFAGNKPAMVNEANDGLLLPASKAEIHGNAIAFENEFKNIGLWHGANDQAAWSIQVEKAGAFDVHLDYACANSSAGNKFSIGHGTQSLTGQVAGTGGGWNQYRQIKVGSLQLEAGQQRIVIRAEGAIRGALMDLRTVAMTRPGMAPRWPHSTSSVASDGLARDPASLARVILDSTQSNAARESAINANPQFASELILELTRDLTPGSPVEYQRIPWIWRVAMACGRRNDAGQIQRVLAVSLPNENDTLRDWQAVVVGGGIINGLSKRGLWPAERVREIIDRNVALQQRWERALNLAATMADDSKIPNGTRYDALRMLGAESFAKRGAQLVRYLARGTNEELQMGSVSGLLDVNAPEAATALVQSWPGLSKGNREMVLDGMLRREQRIEVLLSAIATGQIKPAELGDVRTKNVTAHPNEALRKRASEVLAAAR